MVTAMAQKAPSGGYGAVEIKEYIKKSTLRGFVISTVFFGLMLLTYVVSLTLEEDEPIFVAPPVKIQLQNLPPPPAANEAPPVPPPPTEVVVASGPAARAGTPVPVPDALIPEDIQDFANTDEIARATAEGGEEDFSGFGEGEEFGAVEIDIAPQEEEVPDAYDFIPVEKQPFVDLGELQKKVKYPAIAQRAGLEGQVVIRVLVGKDGKPQKHIIESTDNDVFNDAAIEAVMSSVFTPAIQNEQPVQCWVSIPIKFRLR